MTKQILINHKNRRFTGILILLLLMAGLNACKKVDDHYASVINQPWVTTGQIYIDQNTTRPYNYPQSALVGDTITIQGKIFISQGGYVQVGNVRAILLADKKITASDGSTVDQVRFIVTTAMGIGAAPVNVIANGITINLPSINIRQYAGIPQRTDTTLYVSQVAQFQPVNLTSYQNNNLNLLVNSSVDANGTIWFDNPLGIFKVNGSQVQNIIRAGTTLNDAAGSFIINRILGSVISYDGNTLSFSASVRDNTDTITNYVFKLCQLHLSTNTVTTLNRTLVSKQNPATDGSPGAFEGNASQLNIVAIALRTGATNDLYFNNVFEVSSPNAYPASWYSTVSQENSPFGSGQYVIDNICQLDQNQKVSSIFSYHSTNGYGDPVFKVPGYLVDYTADYKITPDGLTAYVYDKQDPNGFYSILQYDLQKKVPLHEAGPSTSYKFISYDNNPATSYPTFVFSGFDLSQIGSISPTVLGYLLPLPNGTILGGAGASIAGFNMLDQTVYLYAGTEMGLFGSAPPSQTQATGKSKQVNFNGSYLTFCGVDKNGAVYYVNSASGYDLTSAPLTFYKIYSKK